MCPECEAFHWKGEMLGSSIIRSPRFGMCCNEGDKILSRIMEPSEPLYRLLTSPEPDAVQFRKNIRRYNATFAFISLGVKLDDRLKGDDIRPFQIHGEIYHQIGTLEPEPGQPPIYAQHYLYDEDEATVHRFERNPDLDRNVFRALEIMLRTHNPFPRIFRFAYEILQMTRIESAPLLILIS